MIPFLSKISVVPAILLLTGCRGDTVRLSQFAVHGIDVSHYQRFIDWEKIATEGIDFVFIKATEGTDYRDSIFHNNWREVKRVGLRRGAYHFFRPSVSAHLQALNFVSYVPLESGDLPPVLGVEVLDGIPSDRLVDSIRIWLDLVEDKLNRQPILYTNFKFYQTYLSEHFGEVPLWIARYYQEEPYLTDNRDWHFWQYGNRGRLPGIEGYVDFNVFKGSSEDLKLLTGDDPDPTYLELADSTYILTAP